MPDFLTGAPAVHALSTVYDAEDNPIAILKGTIYCSTLAEMFSSSRYGDKAQLFLEDMRDGSLILDRWHDVPGNIYDMMGYDVSKTYEGDDFIGDIMAGKTGKQRISPL